MPGLEEPSWAPLLRAAGWELGAELTCSRGSPGGAGGAPAPSVQPPATSRRPQELKMCRNRTSQGARPALGGRNDRIPAGRGQKWAPMRSELRKGLRGEKPLGRGPASSGGAGQPGRGTSRGGGWKGKALRAFKRNLPPRGMKISFVLKSKQANTCSAQLNTNSQSYYLLFLPRQHSGTSLGLKGFPVCSFVAEWSKRQRFSGRSDTARKGKAKERRVGRQRKHEPGCMPAPASSVRIERGLSAGWFTSF